MRKPLALFLALFPLGVFAQPSTSATTDSLVELVRKSGNIPGMTVTVVKGDKIVAQKGFGTANLEHNIPIRANSSLEIGSVTKQMTAVGILLLVKEGKVNLDAPITTYLKDVPASWSAVTVRRALNHTGGLREYLSGGFDIRIDHRPRQILDFMGKKELDFAPGDSWAYSNGGYAVAGAIIEELSGMTWRQYMKEKVFDPLGMKNTMAQNRSTVMPGRVMGYNGANPQLNMDFGRQSVLYAAGAILSNGEDMAKWLMALDQDKLGLGSLRDELYRPALFSSGRPWGYGLGWDVTEIAGSSAYLHGGNTFGFSAVVSWIPSERIGVVILANAAGKNFSGLAAQISREYMKKPVEWVAPARQTDPNPARAARMLDAFNSMMERQPSKDLIEEELLGILRTERGSQIRTSLKATFVRATTLFYRGERPFGKDTEVTYEVVGPVEKGKPLLKVIWRFIVSPEGRLVRIVDLFSPRL